MEKLWARYHDVEVSALASLIRKHHTLPSPETELLVIEVRQTWDAMRDSGSQIESFTLMERMVDRVYYGRTKNNPSLITDGIDALTSSELLALAIEYLINNKLIKTERHFKYSQECGMTEIPIFDVLKKARCIICGQKTLLGDMSKRDDVCSDCYRESGMDGE